jgi:hypothetical protein
LELALGCERAKSLSSPREMSDRILVFKQGATLSPLPLPKKLYLSTFQNQQPHLQLSIRRSKNKVPALLGFI